MTYSINDAIELLTVNGFNVNQIVAGKACGTFLILGFEMRSGERMARLKAVNPADHTQTARGELTLPIERLKRWEREDA
jgi:hypothetical protein